MNAPCKGCEERHSLCHANCSRYAQFRAERDRINQARDRDNRVYRNHKRWIPRHIDGEQ